MEFPKNIAFKAKKIVLETKSNVSRTKTEIFKTKKWSFYKLNFIIKIIYY